MKKLWMAVGVIMCAVVLNAVAEEHHENECCGEVEVFDRNIRLDFKMSPAEENARPLFLITATPWFETNVTVQGEDGEREFSIEGTIKLLDEGKIFIQFEASARMEHYDDSEAEFFAGAGIILTTGKEMSVATLGDKTLIIKATYME